MNQYCVLQNEVLKKKLTNILYNHISYMINCVDENKSIIIIDE